MKKMLFNSKKSGFKLLSLLFVVGLTFAACSQDVDGQIGNLQDQIDDVRSNLDKEIAARSEAIQKLQSQLDALQATHAADIKKLQDADAKLSQAIADAEKAAEEFAAAKADAAEAAAKAYADAQDKVILATAEAAAAEAEANAKAYTEAQIASLKAQLEKELADAVKALDDKYAAEVAALKAKDADLEKSVEAAKADLEKAIEAAKAELNKKIGDEIARIEAAHKADISRIDAAVAALEGRVADIEAWETTAKTQIAANETAISALKGDLSKEIAAREAADKALQTALNTLSSKVDANYNEFLSKCEELKKADDELYADIVDNAKKIKDLQDADVELGKRIDGVVADLEAAQKAIQAEIDKIYKQIGDLFDKYDALNKALVAAIDNQAKVNGDLKAKDEAQDKALEAAVAALQQAIADAIAQAKEDQAVVDAAQDQALQAAIAQFEDALAAAVAAQAAIDAAQDAALGDAIEAQAAYDATQDEALQAAIAAFEAGLNEVYEALGAAIEAQAAIDAAQDEANDVAFAAVYAALSAAVDEQATVDAAQDAALEAARLALEGAIASAKSELEGKIANAVTKAENDLTEAKKELNEAIEGLGAKLSASIKVLAGTPTTLIFKPVAYRDGIETVVFEPVFYYSMENELNDEVDFYSWINGYQSFDFSTPLDDYDPYVQNTDVDKDKKPINKVNWIKSSTHYVNLPAEVHYFVNPSNASIKDLKLNYPDVQFLGNVAEVGGMTRGYSEENEDVAGLIALNYNSHYTNVIENQTLKFRIDLVSQAVDNHGKEYPVGTIDFANNENGKISFGWPTFADFGGKQNPNYYSGRVDAGYSSDWWGWFYDNSSKEAVLDKIRNSRVTFRGNDYWFEEANENTWNQSYVFATQIPFAGNDENVKGKTVVSDYAQVAVEGAYAQFALVTKGSTEEYLNPNKYNAYVLQGNYPGAHKPSYVGTQTQGDKTVVYDLYAGENNGVPFGFDWNQSYKLTDFIDLLEGDDKYNGTHSVYNVDAMRMEDLGFQYRFYVPMAKASAKTKNVDLWGDMAKEFGHENYLGPNFGPYEYYFGDSKIDFQDYLEINAKTGEIKILKPEVSKGFTPVVLAQVIDTRRPYSPVVTEAYFRLVIKGEEVKGEMEAFDFPTCDKPDVEVPVDAAWFKTNVYDKFSTNNSKFNYYFNATIKEATPNTYFVWRRWKDEKHTEAITIGKFQWDGKKVVWDEDLLSIYPISSYKDTDFLVMCTPFKDLVGKMSETAIDNKTQITWTLGGNVVTLDLNAKAALPVIQLAYSDSYWDGAVLPKHGDANFFATIIANPNPASEQSSEKYCSFDFDLTTGFNHFQKPTGYAQDAATKIYYKATFDGRDVSKEVDGCYTFDIVPARHNLAFDTPEWFGYDKDAKSDKFRYSFNTAESTYLELGEKVNGKPYYDYKPALWYRDGSSYGYYNVLLKEAEGKSHTPALSSIAIDTPWGFEKGIDLLEKDMDVPCLVFATYHGGDEYTESLVIEQFKLDYKKPIIVTNKQAKPFEFVDITHKDQIIKTTDVVALTDWLGNPVKAEKVAIIHTHGKFTPEELSAYYNVDNPYFVAGQDGNPVCKTDLKVNANGTYTHQCVVNFDEDGNIESIGTPTGTLPDKTVLKFAQDGNIYYQNAGASLDQDYHIFVEVEVPHKWGVAKGYVVITVKSNKK